MTIRTVIFASVAAAAACSAKKPSGLQNGDADGGAETKLQSPVLDGVPSRTPLKTVAVRGTTNGNRIIVQGGAEATVVSAALPSDAFCVDVPIDEETEELRVFAAEGGTLSDPVDVPVQLDPAAETPFNAMCSGTTSQCVDAEICDDGFDNDCNGWEDGCDSACSGCEDDVYEPNDEAASVPELSPGSYDLEICPCRDDWFAFARDMGQSIQVSATFDHDQANLNLRLFFAGTGQEGEGEYLVGSFSATDFESIDHVAEVSGLYFLRIYPFDSDGATASYTLIVD